MPNKSKARKQRLEALAKARANNPNNNKNNNSNISLNDAFIDTQLETTDHSESETNEKSLTNTIVTLLLKSMKNTIVM